MKDSISQPLHKDAQDTAPCLHPWLPGRRRPCKDPSLAGQWAPVHLIKVLSRSLQGGDDTFGGFPDHLRTLVSHALPNLDVLAVTYPKFETRGELKDCVGRFREWYGLDPGTTTRTGQLMKRMMKARK